MKQIWAGISKRILTALTLGFLVGVLWLAAIRFITYESDAVHYHANFALYVEGEHDKFDNFTFYEEVQSCGGDLVNDPKTRVHMHNQENHVVHVHDSGVTWGAFFSNLGYTLGNNILVTDDGHFIDGQNGRSLSFTLNGESVQSVSNRLIESQDVLLISYGKENDEVLHDRYDAIPRDAGEYNGKYDPGGCSGGQELSFGDRLKHSIGIEL